MLNRYWLSDKETFDDKCAQWIVLAALNNQQFVFKFLLKFYKWYSKKYYTLICCLLLLNKNKCIRIIFDEEPKYCSESFWYIIGHLYRDISDELLILLIKEYRKTRKYGKSGETAENDLILYSFLHRDPFKFYEAFSSDISFGNYVRCLRNYKGVGGVGGVGGVEKLVDIMDKYNMLPFSRDLISVIVEYV